MPIRLDDSSAAFERDFRDLLGCTPRQLARSPQPILALGLEPRQARRLELLGKLDGERPAPWR